MFSNIQMKITKQFHPVINFITFYGPFSLNKTLEEGGRWEQDQRFHSDTTEGQIRCLITTDVKIFQLKILAMFLDQNLFDP